MRVTDSMMSRQSLRNISRSFGRLGKAQNTVSSGRAINKPSDSPDGTARALRLRTQIRALTQYTKNVNDANDMLEMADLSLDQVSQVISRLKELALGSLNGTRSESDLKAAGAEAQELSEELFNLANTEADGRYIFAGDKTWGKYEDPVDPSVLYNTPFTKQETIPADPAVSRYQYLGSKNESTLEISPGATATTGLVGDDVFKISLDSSAPDNKTMLFDIVDNLSKALNDGVRDDINNSLQQLSSAEEHILSKRVSVGTTAGRLSRLEGAKDRLDAQKLLSEEILTNIEYADFAEAASYLAEQETVYQAALSVAAKASQRRSLVDYLR